jgi:hypothetical protein
MLPDSSATDKGLVKLQSLSHVMHILVRGMQEDMVDVREQLLNQLVLVKPPSFVYAAQPPAANNRRRKRTGAALLRGASEVAVEDEESMTVFGSYAAVTICDGRWVLCRVWTHFAVLQPLTRTLSS